MALSSLQRVSDALDTTRSFLIPPSLSRYSKLALLVLFFGTAGTPVPASPQLLDPRIWQGPESPPGGENETAGNETGTTANETADVLSGGDDEGLFGAGDGAAPSLEAVDITALLSVLVTIAAVLLVLVGLYYFVGTVLRFVFVESLRSERVRLRQYARRHFRRAAGVFALQVSFIVLALPAVAGAVVVASPFGPVQFDLAGAAIAGLLALAWSALLVVAYAITQQFVIPVMIEHDCGVIAGWRRLWPTFTDEYVEYIAFGLVRVALGVAVGIASAIALIVAAIVLLIVFGTVGGVVVLAAGSPFSSIASAVAFAGLAVLFVLSMLVAFAYINVPFQTYLWYYSLLVLGDIDEELDLIPEQRAAAEADRGGVFDG